MMNETPGTSPSLDLVGLTPSFTYPETKSELVLPDPTQCTLLQLTDLHFFADEANPERDKRTLEDLPRLVEHAQPDLLMVTGDLWHENPDGRGASFMQFGIEAIAALGVPWLFVWGNHDVLDDYATGHDALHDAPRSLYRGGPSGGNYRVEIRDASGSTLWELVCMNSMGRGFQAPQKAWLAGEVERRKLISKLPPAFAVFHIPLKQYDEIWESGVASGIKNEAVCYWDEDGSMFPLLTGLGSVRACFCGHDHTNDYAGHLNGTELAFGRATGHGGYGGELLEKGAKIIRVSPKEDIYQWGTLLPNGKCWRL